MLQVININSFWTADSHNMVIPLNCIIIEIEIALHCLCSGQQSNVKLIIILFSWRYISYLGLCIQLLCQYYKHIYIYITKGAQAKYLSRYLIPIHSIHVQYIIIRTFCMYTQNKNTLKTLIKLPAWRRTTHSYCRAMGRI